MDNLNFNTFIGIDWSGDKNKSQKGISVAMCEDGITAPIVVQPKNNFWSRNSLLGWIENTNFRGHTLIGFDFAFSYPFHDKSSYFPNSKISPDSPKSLWQLIENINNKAENFYGGFIWKDNFFSHYYNSPGNKGSKYEKRRRLTEVYAKEKFYSPSPVFNCVGPGSVGTGTLAGMRFLNYFYKKISIWPFSNLCASDIMFVEIFPTYYFRMAGIVPEKNIGYSLKKINVGLDFFQSDKLSPDTLIRGPDQDDADAIISSAALRSLSKVNRNWCVPSQSKKEGWIFGI